MNRGVGKRPLFEDRDDQRFFLSRLARQFRSGRIEVHSFCLMTTHFHLLLHSPIGQLSEAMRRIQNEHSRRFNRRRQRDGTLIRGRYFSKPVRSLAYRRTLISYIDSNPVKARIVRRSAEHEFGSARAYLQPRGPRWLTRDWVEREACSLTGSERFEPAAYLAAFGGGVSPEALELIQARISSTAIADPLDDLIGATPAHVRAWMQRMAMSADGCRVGLPVCGPRSLRTALSESLQSEGRWLVEDGRIVRTGEELARAGLMRSLCGLDRASLASFVGASVAQVLRREAHHRRLLVNDGEYAERVARVAKHAMRLCGAATSGPR